MEEKKEKNVKGLKRILMKLQRRKRKIQDDGDLIQEKNRINIERKDILRKEKVNMIRIFKIEERNGMEFNKEEMKRIKRQMKIINEEMREKKEEKRILIEIIKQKRNKEIIMRRMKE